MTHSPIAAAALAFLILFLTLDAPAQIDEREPVRPRTIVRTRIQTRVKVVRVPEVRYQRISGVAITTVQPNAEVTLESVGARRKFKKTKLTDDDGVLNLENVPPGKYTLTVSLDGYVTEESDVEVRPQQLVTVPVNLAPITYDLFVKTNVNGGEVRYAPVRGEQGGPAAAEPAGFCTVPIRNGGAEIARLQQGRYTIEVRPADVEYQPLTREIAVNEEELAKIANTAGRSELQLSLPRKITTEDFLANWLPGEWRLPAGWQVAGKRMLAAGPGVAILANERYNFYRDLDLRVNARSLDNRSVGIVLRARDDKNYYLIRVNGAAAAQPYYLTGHIVKDGQIAETLVPANIRAYAPTISDGKYFYIIVEARGNIFKISLEDIDTGRTFVIGIIEDQNNTYPIGAAGIGSTDSSRFEVNQFHINYK